MYYADNPIVVQTQLITGNNATFPSGAVCRQLHLRANGYEFTAEVGSSDIAFDISSAARALLRNDYLREPGTARTNSVTITITGYASYMLDGEVYTSDYKMKMEDGSTWTQGDINITARAGGLPETNRWLGQTTNTYNSIKPTDGEIVNIGDSYYHNGTTTALNTAGATTIDGRNIYVENNPKRRTIVFLNTFCEFESFSFIANEALTYPISTEKRSIVNTPSFVPRPSLLAVHSQPNATIKLSSGFLTSNWVDWVLTELATAKRHWLKLASGSLLPITLTPEEKPIAWDLANPALCSVNFTAEAAVTGPMPAF